MAGRGNPGDPRFLGACGVQALKGEAQDPMGCPLHSAKSASTAVPGVPAVDPMQLAMPEMRTLVRASRGGGDLLGRCPGPQELEVDRFVVPVALLELAGALRVQEGAVALQYEEVGERFDLGILR